MGFRCNVNVLVVEEHPAHINKQTIEHNITIFFSYTSLLIQRLAYYLYY